MKKKIQNNQMVTLCQNVWWKSKKIVIIIVIIIIITIKSNEIKQETKTTVKVKMVKKSRA